MAYRDHEVRKQRDRERYHSRVAKRLAAGRCPRCGQRPPAPGRSVCGVCAEKSRAAGRARDARLRAAGKPRRDPGRARECERERSRRQAEQRRETGLCSKCGRTPVEPDRRTCGPCLVKKREADRIRYHKAKDARLKYGGKSAAVKRKAARNASRQRPVTRRDSGVCTNCGRRPPVEGGTTCEACRIARREADRELYAARRAAELCVRCSRPTNGGGSRCAPCSMLESDSRSAERKNEAARRRYRARKMAGRCTDCNAPSQGAARCDPCARRSYERSDHVRGMPLYPPSFTVFLIETDEPLATFDDEMEVAAFIAFEKPGREQVEVVRDASPLATLAGWE